MRAVLNCRPTHLRFAEGRPSEESRGCDHRRQFGPDRSHSVRFVLASLLPPGPSRGWRGSVVPVDTLPPLSIMQVQPKNAGRYYPDIGGGSPAVFGGTQSDSEIRRVGHWRSLRLELAAGRNLAGSSAPTPGEGHTLQFERRRK
jgi:hypothetical protein